MSTTEFKESIDHIEKDQQLDNLAERGHAVTDEHGNVLLQFDAAAEKRLVRKIDLFVVPTVAMIYLWCFIDRANIGNAKIAGMEKDLNLHGYRYNILLTSFYVSYIIFEIPSNIMCKWVGPALWLPAITFLFGLMSMATAFVHSFGTAVRDKVTDDEVDAKLAGKTQLEIQELDWKHPAWRWHL
ncbi:hypothetical protein CspHIS471_0700550 [Cutaneotrichosporon sp. HIS471]|nr:hypothetical protein CspHIS471_0700550 [Cutaneotrichosporon sp. HIS471]